MTADGIGERLRAARQARGESLNDVAWEVGVDPSHLSKIETGRRTPSLGLLRDLARYYGLALSVRFDAPIDSNLEANECRA